MCANTILVVAAHPDDEVLGCGGTIAQHCDNGDNVCLLLMADGVTSRLIDVDVDQRKSAAKESAKLLGVKELIQLSLPDNRMDSIPILEIIQMIEEVVDRIKPSIVYTHHHGDLNIDHVITNRAVMTACRPLPSSTVNAIYGFEVLSSTGWGGNEVCDQFSPTYFVDVTVFYDKKIAALGFYSEEMADFPHARSVEAVNALMTLRGAQSGIHKAEAFTVLRLIKR